MRHHFGDSLARDGGYWTIVPNRERYAHRIDAIPEGSPDATIVTLGKDDAHWQRVLTLPKLEELTLHEPTPEQLAAAGTLQSVKRLRVTHARPKTIDFIRTMSALEEVVLEYVSGFSDMAPLGTLKNLRALHVENLRRVSDFGGLAGSTSLRYLAIHGTFDWQQTIANFEFLAGLPALEEFALWQARCQAPYPALLPALRLDKLRRLRIPARSLDTAEFALLEAGLAGVDGARWGPYTKVAQSWMPLAADDPRAQLPDDVLRARHPEVRLCYDGRREIEDPASQWFEFTGRGAGRVQCSSASAEARCRQQALRYEELTRNAAALLARQR